METNTYTQQEVSSNINKLTDEMEKLKLQRTELSQRINSLKKQIDAWK